MIIWWTKKINKNERQKQLKSFERVYWESIKVSGKQKRKRWGGLELSLRRELEAAVLSKDRAKRKRRRKLHGGGWFPVNNAAF